MTHKEDYEMLVKMIDDTQKQIEKNTKDRLHLIEELELLQHDLMELRTGKSKVKINSKLNRKGAPNEQA